VPPFKVYKVMQDINQQLYERKDTPEGFIPVYGVVITVTTGNILVLRTDMFIPCSLKKLQEVSGLKERAFRTFKKELQEKDYIKIDGGLIYVNPLFTMSLDMDYIRYDLKCKFPKYEDAFNRINKDLM
jgi:hypothetical protein